ncbi:hypothetical protein [Streptomyces sp. TRM75563]|uniref:hypothetical protein n=1 Tax=Streptomyces sp. TRM75563 TaxID=2817418 RepID=UPI001F605E00|nr:hypothetical protein [Streptomyces sp. TRM75563]MCI4043855.1 hypothetical protein [Streptomyces sp. TRM75563]
MAIRWAERSRTSGPLLPQPGEADLAFEPDMNSRLDLDLSIRPAVPGPRTPQDEAAPTPA